MANPDQAKICTRYSHRENLKRARQAREHFQHLQAMTVRTDAPDSLQALRQHRQQLRQWRGLMVYWMDAASEGRPDGSTSTARRLTTRSCTVSAL